MMHYHCFEIYINVVSTDILAEIGVFWGNFFWVSESQGIDPGLPESLVM